MDVAVLSESVCECGYANADKLYGIDITSRGGEDDVY